MTTSAAADTGLPTRLPGEGHIEGPRNGKYRFKCPDGHGERIASKWSFTTPVAAEAALLAFRDSVANGTFRSKRAMTLQRYWEKQYLPDAANIRDIAGSTLTSYKAKWVRWVWSGLTKKPLFTLKKKDVRVAAKKIAREVEHPESYLALLHTVLVQAMKDYEDDIPANVAEIELDMKDTEEEDEERLRPTPEELAALLACKEIGVPDWHAMAFAMGSGLRPGEWRSLEIADVHLDDEVPYVLVQYGGTNRAKTKTRKKRKVPALGVAFRALRSWMPQIATHHPVNPHGLVFPTERGLYRRQDAPFGRHKVRIDGKWRQRSKFDLFLKKAGIERHLHPHCLRHGFATEALTGGALVGQQLEIWQTQIMLGHDRITTTLKYVHPGERDLFKKLRGPSPVPAPAGAIAIAGGRNEKAPGSPGLSEHPSGLDATWCRREDSNLVTVPSEPSVDHPQADFVVAGTALGLDKAARELLARIIAGDVPTESESGAFAARVRSVRLRELLDSDPVLKATNSVAGPTYLPALLRLLDRLIPDASNESKAGVR